MCFNDLSALLMHYRASLGSTAGSDSALQPSTYPVTRSRHLVRPRAYSFYCTFLTLSKTVLVVACTPLCSREQWTQIYTPHGKSIRTRRSFKLPGCYRLRERDIPGENFRVENFHRPELLDAILHRDFHNAASGHMCPFPSLSALHVIRSRKALEYHVDIPYCLAPISILHRSAVGMAVLRWGIAQPARSNHPYTLHADPSSDGATGISHDICADLLRAPHIVTSHLLTLMHMKGGSRVSGHTANLGPRWGCLPAGC